MDTTTLEIGTTEWIGLAIAECNRMLAGSKSGGSDDKFLTFGCLVVAAFVAIVIGFVIWAIWRLI